MTINRIKGFIKAKAMSRTIADDPLQKFMFRLSIEGLPTEIGFMKVGGLSREIEVIEYLEGMFKHAHKLSGREKFTELTLERGMFADTTLEDLFKKVLTDSVSRTTITLSYLDRVGAVKRQYILEEAWASKWESGNLDASSADVLVEKATIQFESIREA